MSLCNFTASVASTSWRPFCVQQQAACNSGSSISTCTTTETAAHFPTRTRSITRYTSTTEQFCISHAMPLNLNSNSLCSQHQEECKANRPIF